MTCRVGARRWLAASLLVLGLSPAPSPSPYPTRPPTQCVWRVALYTGHYNATRIGALVRLTATGSTGVIDHVFLERMRSDPAGPPRFSLWRAECTGIKILPAQNFDSTACLEDADSKIRVVVVEDQDGRHELHVD